MVWGQESGLDPICVRNGGVGRAGKCGVPYQEQVWGRTCYIHVHLRAFERAAEPQAQAWDEDDLCPGGRLTPPCKSACQLCSGRMRKTSQGTCGFGDTGCVSLVCRFGQARKWSQILTPASLSRTLAGLLCGHLPTRFWGCIIGVLARAPCAREGLGVGHTTSTHLLPDACHQLGDHLLPLTDTRFSHHPQLRHQLTPRPAWGERSGLRAGMCVGTSAPQPLHPSSASCIPCTLSARA